MLCIFRRWTDREALKTLELADFSARKGWISVDEVAGRTERRRMGAWSGVW